MMVQRCAVHTGCVVCTLTLATIYVALLPCLSHALDKQLTRDKTSLTFTSHCRDKPGCNFEVSVESGGIFMKVLVK